MKSTWFGNRHRYDFAKLVNESDYGLTGWDKFSGFIKMAVAPLKQACHKMIHGELDQSIEDEFEKTRRQFKYPDRMAMAMGCLTMALEERAEDFLGSVMSEWGQNDVKWRGQCFTPSCLSELMGQMIIGDMKPVDGQTLMIQEPACGAGSMIIGASETLKRNGFYPWHYHWHAIDVDWRCCAMTYIQTTLLGIPCVVIHGNALSLEITSVSRNLISILHPEKKTKRLVDSSVSHDDNHRDGSYVQGFLFEGVS